MEVEIYCDESNQQLLSSSKPENNRYFLIGGLWLPAIKRNEFKRAIAEIRVRENCYGEAKWNAVSPSRLSFYLSLVDFFFNQDLDLRFRCIVIDSKRLDLARYHEADQELGYYKFCYQLLKNRIDDFNSYSIFLDCKTNRARTRLTTLHKFLAQSNLLANVRQVQTLPSNQMVLIQLADVLLGAVAAKFNKSTVSTAKLGIIEKIEQRLGHAIMPTSRGVRKFNIFRISL